MLKIILKMNFYLCKSKVKGITGNNTIRFYGKV